MREPNEITTQAEATCQFPRLVLTEIPEGTPRIPGALPDEIILRIVNGTISAEELGAHFAALMN